MACPKIVFLDDSDDLRFMFIKIIWARFHEDCCGYASLPEMMKHKKDVLHSKLVVLDINLGEGEPNGIDAYNWLRSQKFEGKILFLTGHARTHPLVHRASLSGAEVWEKPVNINNFIDSIRELTSEHHRSSVGI